MAHKENSAVFLRGDDVRQFLRGRNKIAEAWVARNYERLGLDGPIHASTVSRALGGYTVAQIVVDAMDKLYDEIRNDPWKWCKPPQDIDDLCEYASARWWHETLDPPVSKSRFDRIKQQPLTGADREVVQTRFDAWRDKLKAACDQYMKDAELVRAFEADDDPEYQYWTRREDGSLFMWGFVPETERDGWQRDPDGSNFKRRVGNAGLLGRSQEEIGMAWALTDVDMTLPIVDEARLSYSQPEPVPNPPHHSTPVEPWNGEEFDGYEVSYFSIEGKVHGDPEIRLKVRNEVRYYWVGDRYDVYDVKPHTMVAETDDFRRLSDWREPTDAECELIETGMYRKYETLDEFMATADAWKQRLLGSIFENAGLLGRERLKAEYPDGNYMPEVEARFEGRLKIARENDAMARDEQEEIARRRMKFWKGLRRKRV